VTLLRSARRALREQREQRLGRVRGGERELHAGRGALGFRPGVAERRVAERVDAGREAPRGRAVARVPKLDAVEEQQVERAVLAQLGRDRRFEIGARAALLEKTGDQRAARAQPAERRAVAEVGYGREPAPAIDGEPRSA